MRGDLRFLPSGKLLELFDKKLMAHMREQIGFLNSYDISKLAPKLPSQDLLLDQCDLELIGSISPKRWNILQDLMPGKPIGPVMWLASA
jgi:hypothetical protein